MGWVHLHCSSGRSLMGLATLKQAKFIAGTSHFSFHSTAKNRLLVGCASVS
jgi:hypothetical protein